jgi:hypothetical protein
LLLFPLLFSLPYCTAEKYSAIGSSGIISYLADIARAMGVPL